MVSFFLRYLEKIPGHTSQNLYMVVHTVNPSAGEAEASGSELEASLVYRASSRTARATQRNPISKGKKKEREKKEKRTHLGQAL